MKNIRSATNWAAARQASLSITNSQSLPKPMPIKLVMPSSHLFLCHPLLLLQLYKFYNNSSKRGSNSSSNSNIKLPLGRHCWKPFIYHSTGSLVTLKSVYCCYQHFTEAQRAKVPSTTQDPTVWKQQSSMLTLNITNLSYWIFFWSLFSIFSFLSVIQLNLSLIIISCISLVLFIELLYLNVHVLYVNLFQLSHFWNFS